MVIAGMSKLMPGSSDADKEAAAAAEIPVGRMGTKWDIAMAVVYLSSPAAGMPLFGIAALICRPCTNNIEVCRFCGNLAAVRWLLEEMTNRQLGGVWKSEGRARSTHDVKTLFY